MPLSRESLERLIEASPDIVVATDAQGNVAYYNDGAQENLGYSRDEIIGSHVTRLYPSRDEARRVMRAMRDPSVFAKGRVYSFPTRFVAKDGHEIPVAISGVILYGDDGGEQGTIGFAKDLTEIIRKDQLAVLGEIAVGLSHEINNPLETITNELELLRRSEAARDASGPELGWVETIRREVDRISAQLRRVTEMAEREEYTSAPYLGDARMIDLSTPAVEGAGEGRRALVVDDDAGVRESAAALLEADGWEVAQAADGRQALAALERGRFDVVLTDVVMPDMDGYQLFQEVKRLRPGTPVALMTAFYYDREHVIKRSRIEGLDAVIFKKPVDPERLRKMLAALATPPRPAPSSR